MMGFKRTFTATEGVSHSGRGAFFALCGLFVLVALMGGASRSDVLSLVGLRPAAVLFLGYGLSTLKWEHVRAYRYLFGLAAAMLLLNLVQLIPLPPAIWTSLPGRELIVEIDRMAGLGAVWRPISVAPAETWNSFFALLVPFAVLVLGAQVRIEERGKLLILIGVAGLSSAVLALLQILGPPDGPLYLYRLTNPGAAVGLFANRNHQAVFLASMFPLLAVFASLSGSPAQRVARRVSALGAGMLLVPLIFITGSRSGLLVAAVGLVSMAFLYRPSVGVSYDVRAASGRAKGGGGHSRAGGASRWRQVGLVALVGLVGLGLSVATILQGRGEAFQRVFERAGGGELRFKAWEVIWRMVLDYFPFGSGMGSFVEAFEVAEPRSLLDATYLNHAHNDWLEVLLTGGVAAFLMLLVACGLVLFRAVQLWRARGEGLTEGGLFARLGLALIIQFAIASVGDYPLRTPVLASLFTLAALWAAMPLRRAGDSIDAPGGLSRGSKN